MGKQVSQVKFIMAEPQPSLGILGILSEAFKVTIRNGKLMVSIMLPVFLSFSLLVVGAHIALTPIVDDLSSKMELLHKYIHGSEVDETIRRVTSSSESIAGKKLSLADMLLKIRGRWKGPIITSFYMTLISLSIPALFFIFTGFISVMTEGFSLVLLSLAMVILGAFCYLYVSSVWMLSLVVSVVEDDCSGLKAIDRAGELMKGKRLRGSVLMLLLILTGGIIYIASSIMMKKVGKGNWTHLVFGIPRIWLLCLVKLFMFVAYTVFYHECKKGQLEAGKTDEVGYLPITHEEAV
ncbi:hypothetical protein F0562_009216 [Nyssa sinensis]|uniref:Uncharacterized protein n=1 Tax=Nyssa sinensis TaxID=561372 RepID=A0A5J4ZVD2_9ASTE|nr:hypothetical protein F0562_009216 [Nyssa sinensis]